MTPENPMPRLNSRELQIVRAVCVPDLKGVKEIAFDLGLSIGTVKVYTSRLYRKLGWTAGSMRMLVLWAMANREMLRVELPSAEQFPCE